MDNSGKESKNRDDLISLVSTSVFKGVGVLGAALLIVMPSVVFYEELPKSLQLILTPNVLFLLLFAAVIGLFWIVCRIRENAVARRERPDHE